MAGDPWGELRAAAAALDLGLPPSFEGQACVYLEALARWERIGRLTGYATPALRVRHLLVESLMLLRAVPGAGTPLLDIGSGPGVPGLIVKLARPSWEITLLEASRRRVNFLRDVSRQLGVAGVAVCEGRAEDLTTGDLAGQFATATMRAVSRADKAGALARPFLRPEGVLVQALGRAVVPAHGRVEEIVVPTGGELPWRRRFLIIRRAELEGDVSRGTRRIAGTQHRGRQPEGRRREDHDRR
ncbi:MAG: 16S rRNA (guanine(527)-N(7))-methyltransferase RsmG [Candidatus Rokuibacteriota bacterium]